MAGVNVLLFTECVTGTSEISKSFKQLGYNIFSNSDITKWTHKNGLSYDDCLSMSLECNKHISNNTNELPGFYYIMDKNLKHVSQNTNIHPVESIIGAYKKNLLENLRV